MALAIFERLRTRKREAAQRKEQSFEDLVPRVADGLADESEISATLQAIGRTEDELEAAVVLYLKRQDWQALVDETPAILEGMRDVQISTDALNAEFSARILEMRRQHSAEIEALRQQGATLNSKLSAADNAAARLSDTMPEQIKQRANAVYQQIQKRQAEINSLTERSGRLKSAGFSSMMPRDDSKSRIETLKAEIVELGKQATVIESGEKS